MRSARFRPGKPKCFACTAWKDYDGPARRATILITWKEPIPMRRMHAMFELFLVLSVSVVAGEPPTRRDELHKAPSFLAEGKQGMVVGLSSRRAVRAGLEVLKRGGGAVDAAMASAMTQIVDVAGSYISFAGILTMTYYDAATGKVHFLNAGFNTPIEEKDPLSIPKMDPFTGGGAPSGRTALVPGFMAGVQAAHDRFGKLPFTRVIEPAIALAEDGFDVDPQLAGYLQYRKDVLSRLPETRRVFTKQDGTFYARGDRFRQPELAATLRQVTAHGAAYLYTGDWARWFVDAVRRDGGLITLRDMESYRVTWEEPLETTYHDARIFAPGFSSVGGVDTIEALNLLELSALKTFGPRAQSASSLFWLLQIANNQALSYDTEPITKRYPGRDLSPRARVTKDSARWIWGEMQAGQWPYAIEPAKDRRSHSSGVVAVDRWGNVAAVTHSIYTATWGNTGIFVAGVSIPDPAAFLQDAIRRAGPGRRLPDATSPLIITRDGKPVLASTAIGGGLHQRNVQVLANILEFGMNAQSAVDAPAFLLQEWTKNRAVAQVPRGVFDPKVLDEIRALGQPVNELSPEQSDAFIGYWAGIVIDPKTGIIRAAGTAELPSHAEGY
jgi:gamma-glutamyltranspeptidase / glutathione hydrolase